MGSPLRFPWCGCVVIGGGCFVEGGLWVLRVVICLFCMLYPFRVFHRLFVSLQPEGVLRLSESVLFWLPFVVCVNVCQSVSFLFSHSMLFCLSVICFLFRFSILKSQFVH